jgi:rubrerythrin
LRCEQQARKYYGDIAAGSAPRRVKATAKEMEAEEAGHVKLIQEWMKKVPKPAPGWDEDPDPPRMNE